MPLPVSPLGTALKERRLPGLPRVKLLSLPQYASLFLTLLDLMGDLVLFGPLRQVAQSAFHGQGSIAAVGSTWTILVLTIIFASLNGLANTGLSVAVERDWSVHSL